MQSILKTSKTNGRLLRWELKFQEFSSTVQHIKGQNNMADGLSRQDNTELILLELKFQERIKRFAREIPYSLRAWVSRYDVLSPQGEIQLGKYD